jgi:hypothetical protein
VEFEGKDILQCNTLTSPDFLLGFKCIFWREKVQGTAIVTLAILVPQPPSCSVRHALYRGHILEIWKILRAHFEQLTLKIAGNLEINFNENYRKPLKSFSRQYELHLLFIVPSIPGTTSRRTTRVSPQARRRPRVAGLKMGKLPLNADHHGITFASRYKRRKNTPFLRADAPLGLSVPYGSLPDGNPVCREKENFHCSEH